MPVTDNNIKSVTITPGEWQNWQNAQRAVRAFAQQAEGATGKTLCGKYQSAFNAAIPALTKIIQAKGGDPKVSFGVIPNGVPLKVDSLYGTSTMRSLAIVVMFSFPEGNAKAAATDLLNRAVTRAQLALWNKKYASYVQNMVSADYANVVMEAQDPKFTNVNAAEKLKEYASSQQNTQNAVNQGKEPDLAAQTTSTTSKPITPIQTFEPEVITAAPAKSYAWVWWTLGLASLGGGLYWLFGKKLRA